MNRTFQSNYLKSLNVDETNSKLSDEQMTELYNESIKNINKLNHNTKNIFYAKYGKILIANNSSYTYPLYKNINKLFDLILPDTEYNIKLYNNEDISTYNKSKNIEYIFDNCIYLLYIDIVDTIMFLYEQQNKINEQLNKINSLINTYDNLTNDLNKIIAENNIYLKEIDRLKHIKLEKLENINDNYIKYKKHKEFL